MIKSDGARFKDELLSVLSFYSNDKVMLSDPDKRRWWNALSDFDINSVVAAFDLHSKRSKFKPKPADIIEILASNDGRPEVEEAWAIAINFTDEDDTIVWTEEISAAWTLAAPILAVGDKVGARMAFKQYYERLLVQARESRLEVNWRVSLGNDPSRRNDALMLAKDKGLITDKTVNNLLLESDSEGVKIIGLLTHDNESDAIPAGYKEHIEEIRKQIADAVELSADKRQKEREEANKIDDDRRAVLEEQERLLKAARDNYES